jgi:hypothetical protein
MNAKRAALLADGWIVDELQTNRGFFFAERGNDRVCVSCGAYGTICGPAFYEPRITNERPVAG